MLSGINERRHPLLVDLVNRGAASASKAPRDHRGGRYNSVYRRTGIRKASWIGEIAADYVYALSAQLCVISPSTDEATYLLAMFM